MALICVTDACEFNEDGRINGVGGDKGSEIFFSVEALSIEGIVCDSTAGIGRTDGGVGTSNVTLFSLVMELVSLFNLAIAINCSRQEVGISIRTKLLKNN